MVNLRLIYEQLEAGKAHILKCTLLDSRLALILLDNVAELLMHQTLTLHFGLDDSFKPHWEPAYTEWLSRRKYSLEERSAAEREFEPKTRILHLRLKRLDSDTCIILNTCHKLRCETFHSGTLRDRILQELSRLLFVTVIDLALKLPSMGYQYPQMPLSAENASFLERFGFQDNESLISDEARKKFAAKLLSNIQFNNASFCEALSNDLVERIEQLIETLEYLSERSERAKVDRNLQYTQFWRNLGAKLMTEGVVEPDLEKAFQQWVGEGHAKYTLHKIDRWRRQAASINSCPKSAHALARYSGIDRILRPLEKDVAEAAFKYDQQIDAEIEHRAIMKAFDKTTS